ncbi:SIS domain-containing protein [Patescibacteria group bacterium]|nr:SIS domain-containing protein [Patescibacteria group bacterium]
MSDLEMIFRQEVQASLDTISASIQECLPTIIQGFQCIEHAIENDRAILVCGNGGSAADAQHFSAELLGHYKVTRRPVRAMSLTTDTSTLSAIANDDGYEHVFSRQILGIGREGDVLVAITTSGRSKNILAALEAAQKQRMRIIVLTGRGGIRLKRRKSVSTCIAVPSNDTARIQEVHGLIIHLWCQAIDQAFVVGKL